MSEELKPCPCCGETKPLFFYDYPIGAFTVCCGNCGMRGPATGYSKDGAIRTWNALPRRLRWTREKPTDGWYWLRRPGKTPEVVNVDRGRYVSGKSYGAPLSNEEFDDVKWAGPIQEPEDVK